ncbi:MAG: succinate dehydrogenase cytochrome b subunit [Flavobacterium sp.]|uniref:succinate dehydrogenase cytochrome b subunit n=1 Tax=Flavobacterium sp. TaxID=239 RepID=UPI00120D68AC|nr:succinate dehydrogenase cytochrome b subunit [Flavobacterium sp.]RZJ68039.1 MAG: succinate dehydrogenase cytochrome b subunit [Flavobacterium sp.]
MAKSAILKSSLAKKYWMALTGLFLCLFLVGHLLGNLQILYADPHQFNTYALFMTSNPAVKALSYLTYISILFHAVDGALLTYRNVKARPVGYVKNNPSKNSMWSSRNMGILGTLILVFIVTHMMNFWAVMHFDNKMPLEKVIVNVNPKATPAQNQEFYITTRLGEYIPVAQVGSSKEEAKSLGKPYYIKDRTEIMNTQVDVKMADGYKDLHKITVAFFKHEKFGLLYAILYALAMVVLGLHLWHGFASSFQSIGLNHPKYSGFISKFGMFFATVVPFLFAIIPLYVHFLLKTV